jgi:hypothetical protein
MNQKSIAAIIVLIVALPMAIILGQWAAMDPAMAVGFGLAIVTVVTVVVFGKNLWALVFLAYPFVGALNALPISLSLRDLATLGVAGLIVPMLALRTLRVKFSFGLMEVSLVAVFLMIAQSFVRNPAGVAALGSASIGGRANFEMGVAAMLFMALSTQVVSLEWIKRSMWFYVAAQVVASGVDAMTNLVPAAGLLIYAVYRPLYTGGLGEALAGGASESSLGRLVFFQELAKTLTRLLVSLHSPLFLANPLKPRVVVVVFTIVIALLTGFRSLIAGMAIYALFSALLRRRMFEMVVLAFVGFTSYAILAMGNGSFFNLPLPAQRALSVLPGNWDSRASLDAEGSGDWRFEMWRQALGTDRYIKNKLIGDGYSIPPDVYAYQQSISSGQTMSTEQMQEYFLLIGGYHSGPVETVRRVGYAGLVVLLFCQIFLFREAYRTIRSLRGTDYFTYAMFAGLPLLAGPFIFWLIVGGFHTEVVALCFNAAWLRMIQHSSKAHATALSGSPVASIPVPVPDLRNRRRVEA